MHVKVDTRPADPSERGMRQVLRIIVNHSVGSPDEQVASPDEGGDYEELVQAIDQLVHPSSCDPAERRPPG